jgi:hypothetical protein
LERHIEGQGSQRGCERSSKEKRQLTRCPFRAEGRERTRGLTNGWALAGVSCLKTTRASHTIPGAGRPPGSAGEGATAVPRVSLAVNRMSRDIPTLPSVLTSSHGGFATSSHQACSGFSSLRSLRGDDAAGRGVGVGLVWEILPFPFPPSTLSDGAPSAAVRRALRASSLEK